jgi:hypothetical protein
MLNKDLNLGNKGGLDSFVELAKLTSSNLKKRYGDQWVDPNQELVKDDATTIAADTEVAEKSTKKAGDEDPILPASTPAEPKPT